jgi:sec-independent protein translocase protein TatC
MPLPLIGAFLLRKQKRGPEDPEEFRLTLGEHLDDLRSRIIKILLLLAGGWVAGWFLQPWLYDFLNNLVTTNVKAVLKDQSTYQEAFKNTTEAFMLKFKLSFLIGLVMVFPFCVLQIWAFIAPGLKPSERKPIARLAPLSLLLFGLGAFFCWIILPTALQWFAVFILEFPGTNLIQEPGSMVYFILKMMLAFGIGFQLPLVVYALGAVGLLSAETLVKYWRQAATFVFIASAIITPSNDAFSMLMMAEAMKTKVAA